MKTREMTPNAAGRSGRQLTVLLVLSTVLTGLMAGLFLAFDVSVMPGLAALEDDCAYVAAMRNFNATIDGNALFDLVFLLALIASATATVIAFRGGRRAIALWTAAASAAYLVVTIAANIP
ncbi:hypothetical protein [Streptomyces sp. NPDC048606]|uniref:hypothetical protein n=1 Tax=Streptomyces sp. NPDC048606 TaxID=3154726 RepID=UPI00342A505C